MGRPFEFSREEALEKAMGVFWEKGYKATSIQDLVDSIGIERGSIYNTFGDKHNLFLEALKHYGNVVTSQALNKLNSTDSQLNNINTFFDSIINSNGYSESKGCLLSNSVVEISPHDKKASKIINSILNRIERSFRDCLDRAVEYGEIPEDTDKVLMAKYFTTIVHGLNVACKSNTDKKSMKEVVNVMISSLKK